MDDAVKTGFRSLACERDAEKLQSDRGDSKPFLTSEEGMNLSFQAEMAASEPTALA